MNAAELEKRLLYRDGLMLVVDKPPGLPVHAGPGGGDNLERHLNWLRFGLPKAPSLAHRLDRDTSGCWCWAGIPRRCANWASCWDGKVDKTYWAVTRHAPADKAGRVDAPLKKLSTKSGGWHMAIAEDGQHAVTDWRVLGTSPDGLCWIECHPRTGRTHQIRVHLASLGAPLLGDAQYGDAGLEKPLTLHLQSHAITLPLYPSREPVTVSAEPPPHMQAALTACGWVKETTASAPA